MTSTPNIPPGGGHAYSFPIRLAGVWTADVAAAARHVLQGRHRILGAVAVARASSGTSPTCAVDIKVGNSSVLAEPLEITATAATYATMVNLTAEGGSAWPTVPAGGVITIGLDIGGTTPSWTDIDVTLHLARF
ncbi:hypothetical protein HL658_31350 [Azospirillum sp. RWY-5-1]|uniref:DUF4402 domain-containing protein n=1 Tax=Azospirillum oleiclasticum TaxID=2735135 RepID=A0ABX2TJG9_9PROT|nr:hypothetical protein [Azospirillum oleiclasticum]NYZ17062.1 hypothetical protein [Azospirillum oleiclasticum]NYZ24494.1 hypothetical protein [Azospirillum oleiclasticum]